MGGKNVKNTIVERILQIVAPHLCFGCGKTGVVLCSDCKYDIISEPFGGCIACAKPKRDGVCTDHWSPIEKAFVVSQRTGTLEALINGLKFHNVKAAALACAQLLHDSLPQLPDNTTLVIVPTVRSHIRQRGYDHIELIARQFASLRGLRIVPLLQRVTTDVQHQVGREERRIQAAGAFRLADCSESLPGPILLLDDIITTASTMMAASQQLAKLGMPVWVAALAYQPLD
jgi:predicted amidophosphoribosyltransferase